MLAANLHDKTEYVIHISNLKQVLNHVLVLKKVHIIISFKQMPWSKSYIDVNTILRKKVKKKKNEKYFFKLMNNAVWKNYGKHRDIKFVTTERQTIYLKSEPNFQITKFLTKNLLAIEIKKHKYTSINLSI